MKFINRKKELEFLNKQYESNEASFIPIYGRRRIGKTALISEFIKDKPESIYYLASEQKVVSQIKELAFQIHKIIPSTLLEDIKTPDWNSFFTLLKEIWPQNTKIIFAIDEVTYIINEDKSFSSLLQNFWDSFLSKTKTVLILSGSMQSLFFKEILAYGAPLYGRRSGQIHLKEFTFKDVCKFFGNISLKEKIEMYSMLGGVAKYVLIGNKYETSNELLVKEFLNVNSFFSNEATLLLATEFRDVAVYNNILKSISSGKVLVKEISDYTGIEPKKLSSYLDILIRFGFLKVKKPVTKAHTTFRGAIYVVNDNFLRFWYGLVEKVRSEIELEKQKEALDYVLVNFNKHVSFIFEEIAEEFLKNNVPIGFSVGNEWGFCKENGVRIPFEIDLVAINPDSKKILFCEVKYKDNIDGVRLYEDLVKKSSYVSWNKDVRTEEFILIAKSFKTRPPNVNCYDLRDIENYVKN